MKGKIRGRRNLPSWKRKFQRDAGDAGLPAACRPGIVYQAIHEEEDVESVSRSTGMSKAVITTMCPAERRSFADSFWHRRERRMTDE